MTTRRLAAILAADVAGFSAMMELNEEGTAARIRALRRDVIEPLLAKHHGRLIKTTGDGFLVEFASPVEAVRSAVAIQDQLEAADQGDSPLRLRIGINLGDIIIEDDGDVFGDGVNVAARLEQIAEPGGIIISGAVHEQVGGKIDRSLEDRGEQQVKNIARPVRVYELAGMRTLAERQPKLLALPDRPSIAVLPFTNMSGDPEQEYFADGVVEDIITALSRVKWLFVIARNSSFIYKNRTVDVRQVGRELGVRYVLEGSVRRAGDRVRITGQLIDSTSGSHIWADRFDRQIADIFELQDEITSQVVGQIEPSLRSVEIERARAKPTERLDAYDLYLRALPEIYAATEESFPRAIALLERALAIDARYAEAWAGLADSLGRICNNGWVANLSEARTRILEAAARAAAGDADNGNVLATAAWCFAIFGGQHDKAGELSKQATRLHPNSAHVRAHCGWVDVFGGNLDRALENLRFASRLNPLDPRRYITFSAMAAAHYFRREFTEAVEWSQRALDENPKHVTSLWFKIGGLVMLGRQDEMQEAAAALSVIEPRTSVAHVGRFPLRYPWMSELAAEGLRRAGFPE